MSPGSLVVRVAAVVTLGAGCVAVARQRREALAVRRGERPPPHAEVDPEPPPAMSPVGQRISTWLPSRPRTAPGRIAASLWALPLSAVGLAVGLAGLGRPVWNREHGCLVFEGTRGLPARLLRSLGAGANAMGQVVVSTYDETNPRLLAHEATHVRQAERLGPLLLPVYVLFGARYGYRDNPIEWAARLAARRSTGATDAAQAAARDAAERHAPGAPLSPGGP